MKKHKIEPLGNIMLDLESLVAKFVEQHDMQASEILSLVLNYINVHYPESVECFEADDSKLVVLMGHKEEVLAQALDLNV